MAKKNNFDFAGFVQSLEENTVKPNKIDSLEERKYFLIVSEGIRTEPIYFKQMARKLPKHLVNTIEVHGEGDNTVNIVKKAIELRDKRKKSPQLPAYDEVWAVYDRDDFPAERYHEAIDMSIRNGIESGHSNQSFELWYVLHFQYLQNALHRNDYIDLLTKHLKIKYVKNSDEVVTTLNILGNVQQAIKWAKKLENLHIEKRPAEACPYTRIYILIERLLKYVGE